MVKVLLLKTVNKERTNNASEKISWTGIQRREGIANKHVEDSQPHLHCQCESNPKLKIILYPADWQKVSNLKILHILLKVESSRSLHMLLIRVQIGPHLSETIISPLCLTLLLLDISLEEACTGVWMFIAVLFTRANRTGKLRSWVIRGRAETLLSVHVELLLGWGNKNGKSAMTTHQGWISQARCWMEKTDPGNNRKRYHLGKDEKLKKPDSILVVNSFVDSKIKLKKDKSKVGITSAHLERSVSVQMDLWTHCPSCVWNIITGVTLSTGQIGCEEQSVLVSFLMLS